MSNEKFEINPAEDIKMDIRNSLVKELVARINDATNVSASEFLKNDSKFVLHLNRDYVGIIKSTTFGDIKIIDEINKLLDEYGYSALEIDMVDSISPNSQLNQSQYNQNSFLCNAQQLLFSYGPNIVTLKFGFKNSKIEDK